MSRQPVIAHQYTFTVSKMSMIPDARYKSGFREVKTLATNTVRLLPDMAQRFALNHIGAVGKHAELTSVVGDVQLLGVSETRQRL